VQAHPPSTHTWPVWQPAPLPQVHCPWALHPSPLPPQALQAIPAGAQFFTEVVTQVAPLQQPPGQATALHPLQAPEVQLWPAGQAVQVPPAGPQAAASVPFWQLPAASQQPAGQDCAVQVHCPALHSWPLAQADSVPQEQPPSEVHPSAPSPQSVHREPAAPQAAALVGVAQVLSA